MDAATCKNSLPRSLRACSCEQILRPHSSKEFTASDCFLPLRGQRPLSESVVSGALFFSSNVAEPSCGWHQQMNTLDKNNPTARGGGKSGRHRETSPPLLCGQKSIALLSRCLISMPKERTSMHQIRSAGDVSFKFSLLVGTGKAL